jgi:hypothetical protein
MREFLAAIGFLIFAVAAMFAGGEVETWVRDRVPSVGRFMPRGLLPITGLIISIVILAQFVD